MPTSADRFEVHSAPRGLHWIAWLTTPGKTTPDRSVVIVAASKNEAESRARLWADQQVSG